jgi:hypothetical protein
MNTKAAVLGAVALGPLGLAFGAKDKNKIIVTCLSCGHSWPAGQTLGLNPHAEALKNEYPQQQGGFLFRVEKDGKVSAVNWKGERIQFRNWKSFWDVAGN